MGATYTRQSSYSDGDTITAAHTNDEFNQLLAAFAASTGHTHDGTTAEGGPITKLLGTSITIGDGTAGTDIAVTFDGETSDGVLTWKEDEDYFEFSDDILVASTEKLQFRDTAIYINSSTDGQLDLVADTEIQLAATTVDLNGNLDVSGSITLGGTAITSTAAELNILDGVTATAAELNALDGITSTVAELNIVDGGTSASSVTVEDADRVVLNDGGTMKQVAVTDLSAYFDDEITAMPNLVTVGTLDSGAISSGFGNIDIGSSNLTATGTISLGATSFNDNNITNVGSIQLDSIAGDADTNTSITFSGSDVITVATGGTTALTIDASQNVTVAGDLTVTGDDITMGTNTSGNLLVADGTNFNSVAVGDLSEISTVANDDVFLAVDTSGGGLKKITRSTIVSGLAVGGVALSNIVEDTTPQLGGDLDVNSNDIVSTSNGNINLLPNGSGKVIMDGNGSSGGVSVSDGTIDIRTGTGSVAKILFYCESSNAHAQTLQAQPHSAGVTNVLTLPGGGDQEIVGTTDTQTLTNKTLTSPVISTVTGSTITLDSAGDITLDADGADVVLKDGGTTFGSMTNSSGELVIKSGSTPTTAMTFNGANVTLAGNLTVSGTTTTVNSTTVNLNDHNIVLDSGNDTSAVINGAGITIEGGSGDDATFSYNTSGPKFELKLGSSHEDLQVDQLIAASLDISGDADIDGTLEADAITVNGTALATVIAGTTVTNATNSAHVLVTDNESTNEDNLITFVEGATSSTGNVGLEMDGNLTYNPSTGRLTATQLAGTLQTAAQTNITSLGTLSALTVDNIALNGTTIGHTDDTDLITLADGIATVAGEISVTTLDIGGTNVTATAAELNIMDGDTSASSTTLADADRVVTNDNGTMKQVALTDVKTYLSSAGFTTDDPTALAIALG
jgi:hypothetical protein